MDHFMTPTVEMADIVLPAATFLEFDDVHGELAEAEMEQDKWFEVARMNGDRAAILEKTNESDPGNPQNISMLLQLYEMSGNTDKAMATLEKWVELNPDDKGAQNMLNRYRKRLNK